MKNVLGWIKGHLIVVIAALVAIAALPALLFVSAGMNASLREEVQEDVSGEQRSLQQISVQYAVEPLDPSEPPQSFSAAPNAATTEAMAAVIAARNEAADAVLASALERNRSGKTPMLEGVFPAPDPAESTAKRQAAAGAWVRAHEELLRRADARGPVDASDLAVALEARQAQELEKLGRDEATPEDLERIRESLVDFRLQRLRERADDATLFATMETFVGVSRPESAGLPTLAQIWDWQHRYWVHEDIVLAAARANTNNESGLPLSPSDRPVKRLVSIETVPWPLEAETAGEAEAGRDGRGPGGRGGARGADRVGGGGGSAGSLAQEIRPDLEASITGRAGWPYRANPLYDARYATVTAIVDGTGLERFLAALEAQNFMTVVDLDLNAIDPFDALAEGYAYGGGSLLRAEMVIETLWLREWIGELAPDEVRAAMGLGPRETESGEAGEGSGS